MTTPVRAAEPLDEITGTRAVCTSGPDATLARAQRLRGKAEVVQAGVFPNPSLDVQHQRTFTGLSEQETIIGLSAPLGLGGRRFILQDAAASRQEQAALNAQATLFESALAFREAYVAAVVDEARVEVLIEQQAALDGLSAMIQGLTRGGEAAGYDLLRQQTQARLHRRLVDSAKARASASGILLEAWIGREVSLPAPKPLDQGSEAVASSRLDATPATSPRVRSLRAASKASALEARAARRRWVPDIDIFAGYRAIYVGPASGHGISLALSVPLTFFDHGQGEAARADADEELARAAADSLGRHQQAQAKAARARMERLISSVTEARQASTDAALLRAKVQQLYVAGEATITELLEGFRVAEEARLAELDLAEDIALSRLAIMRASGTMFDAALDKDCSRREGVR